MRARRTGSLLAVSLTALLAAAALAGGPRAEAAVYWGSGGFVGAANLDGSTYVDGVPYRAANVPEIGNICGLAVSNGNLYWADSSRGTIGRMGLPASPYGYADFFSERVFIDEAFISGIVNPCGIAVDGGHIYWTSSGNMSIGRANLDGSGVDQTFISGVSSPCGIAVDGSHLYWGSFVGDSIGRANLSGGEVNQDFVLGAVGPCGVAVDAGHLYWSNWDGSSIGRAGIDGSAPDNFFVSGLTNPCGVAVDGSHVFWTNWSARDPVGRANLDGGGVIKSLVKSEFYLASCGVALDAKTFRAPPPPPSAPIFLGKRLGRGENRGAAYITVKVPNTGGTINVLTNGLGWSLLSPPTTEGGYLLYQLKVWPAKTGRAGKKIRSRLARKGRAKVTLEVTYEEAGKGPFRAARPLTLFRRSAQRK